MSWAWSPAHAAKPRGARGGGAVGGRWIWNKRSRTAGGVALDALEQIGKAKSMKHWIDPFALPGKAKSMKHWIDPFALPETLDRPLRVAGKAKSMKHWIDPFALPHGEDLYEELKHVRNQLCDIETLLSEHTSQSAGDVVAPIAQAHAVLAVQNRRKKQPEAKQLNLL